MNTVGHDSAAHPFDRLSPGEAAEFLAAGGLLVDIRSAGERRRLGEIPGALVIDPSVLAWRLHPSSRHHHPWITSHDQGIVLVSEDGGASLTAAAGLGDLGLSCVGDVQGGFDAWQRAGLPVVQYVTAC